MNYYDYLTLANHMFSHFLIIECLFLIFLYLYYLLDDRCNSGCGTFPGMQNTIEVNCVCSKEPVKNWWVPAAIRRKKKLVWVPNILLDHSHSADIKLPLAGGSVNQSLMNQTLRNSNAHLHSINSHSPAACILNILAAPEVWESTWCNYLE